MRQFINPVKPYMSHKLSISEARRLALDAQGLLRPLPFGSGKAGVLRALEHLGYVQIDTISVVARAHHHVFWSRVPDYSPALLHELQSQDRTVLEYWSHAASYLPMSDYRFCLPRMKAYAKSDRHWFVRNRKVMKFVLDRIAAEGPLQARDFEAPAGKKSGPWFDWKPAKRALEQLFMEGALMIRERRGFQKVYDLPERVLPSNTDTEIPTPDEYARHLILRTLRAHGLATEQEVSYLKRNIQGDIKKVLKEMLENRDIVRLLIGGVSEGTYYALTAALDVLASRSQVATPGISILSPFDNSVIQRKRIKRLFDFNYQIECYVPEPKRKFGYFCLPLLRGDRFIGRIDAKADRKSRQLIVHKVHMEPGLRKTAETRYELLNALEKFATFNGCDEVVISSSSRS